MSEGTQFLHGAELQSSTVPIGTPDALRTFLEQEGFEQIPEIEITFLFGAHARAADAEFAASTLAESDIFIPEGVNVDIKFVSDLQQVARGEMAAQTFYSVHKVPTSTAKGDSFVERLAEIVFNSGLVIGHADIKGTDSLARDFKNDTLHRIPIQEILRATSFAKAATIVGDSLKATALWHQKREEQMLPRIAHAISFALRTNSDFSKKDPLRVALFLGEGHKNMRAQTASFLHGNVQSVFDEEVSVSSVDVDIIDAYKRGETPSMDSLEKRLISDFLPRSIMGTEESFAKHLDFVAYLDAILGAFTPEERSDYFELYRDGPRGMAEANSLLKSILKREGVPLFEGTKARQEYVDVLREEMRTEAKKSPARKMLRNLLRVIMKK